MGSITSGNNSTAPSGIVTMLAEQVARNVESHSYVAVAVAVAAVVVALLFIFSSPSIDESEPPAVRSALPFGLGHIIGLLRWQAEYHYFLFAKTRKPIATLPILNGKVYAVWDPALVAAGLRNRELSNVPFMHSMAGPLMLMTDETVAKVVHPDQGLVNGLMSAIYQSLTSDNMRPFNQAALKVLAGYFTRRPDGAVVEENMWYWVRHLMVDATGHALYGDASPFVKDPKLEESLWDFQEDLPKLFYGLFPSIFAPKGYKARAHLQSRLRDFYAAKLDLGSSVSSFVRMRAASLRDYDLDAGEVAKSEMMVPYSSMTNTVPTLYWLLAFVFSSPDLVSSLRAELEEAGVATRDGRKITLDLTRVNESRTPRLLACYFETLRVTNHQTSVRRVMHDTTLTDPSTGRTYLVKAGLDVHLCIGTAHLDPSVWGKSAGNFDPERFLDHQGHVTANSKTRQGKAFQPFGGGVHLCPGKNFAYMEIMATMSTLLLGHEVSLTTKADGGAAAKAGVTLPGYAQWSMVDSIHKPVKDGEGLGIRMERRAGFEGVEWEYKM